MNNKIAFISIFLLSLSNAANANLVNLDLGMAQNFNVFAINNFTAAASDVVGAVAVGGNMNVNNYAINSPGVPNASGYGGYGLVVNGNLTYTNGGMGQGNVYVGGTATTSNLGLPGTVQIGGPAPFSFASAANSLYQLSSTLSGLIANGNSAFDPWGGVIFSGDGTANTQVFNVTGAQLLGVNNISYTNMLAGQTLIFNVSGNSGGFQSVGMPAFTGYNVLFNFNQATQIALNNVGVFGSVLAPYATATGGSSMIDGNVVVNNWLAGTQVHNNATFLGVAVDIPTPGTLALLFPALGLLAWKTRKKSSETSLATVC